ncbi:hypothetical protein D3C72_1859870 [compost metagenome]
MPKISPARTVKLTLSTGTSKWPVLAVDSRDTTSLGCPRLRPSPRTMSLRPAPIIFSAIDRLVSCLGSQVSTSLPPRRMVAVSHSALISCSLCEI